MTINLLFSLQNLHKILLHIDVDSAIPGKGAAAFDVAGSLMSFEKYVFALIDGRSWRSDSGSDGCGLL